MHPVVLPVLAGLAWNLTGLGLHPIVDESLLTLGAAVVPMCLVLIGVTLAAYGVRGRLRGALWLSVVKLLLLPAVVLVVAHWGFGLTGLPLAVVVMMAALPAGSNALIFSQRYETLQAESHRDHRAVDGGVRASRRRCGWGSCPGWAEAPGR